MTPQWIQIGGRRLAVTFERRIIGAQRDVVALARDADGAPVAQQQMSTAAARGYLSRDAGQLPPTWGELEAIALDLLKLQLDDS